jgi:hypothetical protein
MKAKTSTVLALIAVLAMTLSGAATAQTGASQAPLGPAPSLVGPQQASVSTAPRSAPASGRAAASATPTGVDRLQEAPSLRLVTQELPPGVGCQLSPGTGPSIIGQTGPLDHSGGGKVSC